MTNVTVSGTGLTTGNANLYTDGSWAKANATLANGNNTYTATAKRLRFSAGWPSASASIMCRDT